MLSRIHPKILQLTAKAALVAALALAAPPSCTNLHEDNEGVGSSKSSTGSCGVERWSVKTGTDSAAGSVNLTPQDTTIAALDALPVPSGLNSNAGRLQPNEFQAYRLTNVTLTQYKLESDSDYHLILTSGSSTMIAEIPDPLCISGSVWTSQINAARSAFDAQFNATTSFQTANVPVTVVGAGFFDLLHGQTGVAPNGFELHAVLSICFGTNCGGTVSPDFSLAANPTSVTATQGSSGTTSITATGSNGFSGSVALSASGVPAGASASFSPASIGSGGSSTLTLSAGTAAAGTYSITVTGTSGSLNHTTSVSFTVNASAQPNFSLSASPSSVTAAQGASANSTISATPVNSFSGSITLSASGVPTGASAGFSATSISGSGSSTLTLSAGTAAAGTYSITVTGTSGALTHTTSVSFTVTSSGGGGGSLTNGGFETGTLSGWTSAGTASVVTGGHGGTYAARAGSTAATNGDSSIAQTFTAPSNATGLSFYYKVVCPDSVTYDWATATLKDNTAGTTATVVAKTCTNSGAWVQATSSLTANHSYTLTLASHDDNYSGDPTYTLYDDVTITTSGGGGGGGITNGGFETGTFSGWTQSGAVSTITTISHSGTYAAFVGSTSATNGDSSIAQTFTVPAGKSSLSIWYANKCPDSVTYDWATITLKDNTSGSTTTVLPPTCSASSVWTNVTAAVTAGHGYTLTLTNHDDNYSGDPTNTIFDDITLN